MAVAVGDIFLLSYRGDIFSQRIIFTQTFRVTSGSTTGTWVEDSSELAEQFDIGESEADLTEAYLDCIAQNYTMREIRAQFIAPFRRPYGADFVTLSGTSGADASQQIVTAPITLVTNDIGRDQIAVKHIGPIDNAFMSVGAPTLLAQSRLIALAEALLEEREVTLLTGTFTFVPVVYHRATGQNDPLIAYRISDRLGTERRRILRIGE